MRLYRFEDDPEDRDSYTLLQLSQEWTWSDEEFDTIADLQPGQTFATTSDPEDSEGMFDIAIRRVQ